MGRAERRRAEREKKKSETAVYHLTKAQLDAAIERGVREILNRQKAKVTEDAIDAAMALTLLIPMKVLMRDYWQKSYKERLPGFADKIVDEYDAYFNGGLDMEKIRKEVWDLAGIRFEVNDER